MDDETRSRLDDYLAQHGLESIWAATPCLFGWLTGGSNRIVRDGETGVAAAGYDGDALTVVSSSIEGQRLREEELPAETRVETFPWHEGDLLEAVRQTAPTPAAADVDVEGFERLDRSALTQPLTDGDVARYRDASRKTAYAVEEVARGARPEDTERELAAELHRSLQRRGIESSVVLVGGEDRVQRHRHFTPQDVSVGAYAVLTVVGVDGGRNVAVTRTVAFEDAPSWLAEGYHDVCRVAATAATATRDIGRAGGTAGEVFAAIQDAYEALGYPGEWETHHQGGALGYASREWTATPDAPVPIELPMAFGWNPTVPGAKSEDTVLVTEDRIEVLSETGEFPTTSVRAVDRDVTVALPDVLPR